MRVKQPDRGRYIIEGLNPFSWMRHKSMQRVRRYVANGHVSVDQHASRCGGTQQDSTCFMWITGQQMLPQRLLYGRFQSYGLNISLDCCQLFTPLSSLGFRLWTESLFLFRNVWFETNANGGTIGGNYSIRKGTYLYECC